MIAKQLWIVEERSWDGWRPICIAYSDRNGARGHIAGLVANAGRTRRNLRVAKYNRARTAHTKGHT